jgi:DNA polymerase III sliding clamp (beta) subunit (PCNA family)
MVSTDAHYLFTHTFPVESKAEDQLLISTKIAKALDGFESTEIFWNSKHIGFHSNNITVIATRPDDKYPAYKNVIPDYPANLLLDREEVLNALQRCCLSSNASKQTVILLHEEAGTIRFIADDIDFNRKIQVDVNGAYRGPVDRIAVSADRLLTMMKQVNYDKINLHIHHQDKAVLLTSESDAEYLALLMPLHIN